MTSEPIHRLSDLAGWSFPGTSLAVIGHPIAHSLSPAIHNAALAEMARLAPHFATWRYFKFDIPPADLPAALAAFRAAKFRGLNLTVPHKSLVVPALATRDEFVQTAGAANTLIAGADGWHGANTDGYGLATALKEQSGLTLENATVVLLGAGGAARAAAVECLQSRCASLWIGNRTPANLNELLDVVRPIAGGIPLHGFDLAAPAGLPEGALVINATSVGLKADDPAPIDLRRVPRPALVFDMIYRPARTALLRDAATLGIAHANGLAMLVHQGARSLALWTGARVPVAAMHAAAHAALAHP